MIGFATSEMTPGLEGIWSACFGDEAGYTRFIFDRLLRPERILVESDERGAPRAMLCMEPCTLLSTVGSVDAVYIFGVATHPAHQGKGLSTALLDACHERLAGDGYGLSILVPASESLFRFYGKRGYETKFSVIKEQYKAKQIPRAKGPCTVSTTSLGAMQQRRDEIFARRAMFVRWEREYLDYIGAECEMMGGEVLALAGGGESGYAVCYPVENTVVIKEFAVPGALRYDALAAIHARYGAARYQVYLPADTDDTANKVLPFAMVRWYDKGKRDLLDRAAGEAPWIAHVLD